MARKLTLSTVRRAVGYTTGAGAAGGAVTFAYLYQTEPGFERSVRFWGRTAPIVAHYFLERALSRGDDIDREARYLRLHDRYAPAAREVVEELRGMFVKVAQVMSVRPEVVPLAYRTEFRKLQDKAPPVRWEPIREALERDLGAPVGKIFDEIDEVPLGAASIGQAHHVIWKGREAVVKVQYPDSASMLWADFRCLQGLLWLVSPDALPMLSQVWEQFATELDYAAEALNLRDLHVAFEAAPEFAGRICVPEPIPELTSGNVIGMGYLPGPKLETALRARLEALGVDVGSQSMGDWLASQQRHGLAAEMDGAGQDASASSAGRPGGEASSEEPGRASWWWRLGRSAVRLLGLDLVLWLARSASDLKSSGGPGGELRSTLRLLLDAHGYQLFFCPLFNADPHPGNILMLPDGRIGLIDFGQCRRLVTEEKAGLARLILAIARPPSPDADEQLAAAFEATGVRTKHGDRQYLALLPRLMFSRVQAEWLETGNLKEVLLRDRVVEMPIHVVMAYRTAVLLRGLCLVLQENVSVAETWGPWAQKWLHENPIAGV